MPLSLIVHFQERDYATDLIIKNLNRGVGKKKSQQRIRMGGQNGFSFLIVLVISWLFTLYWCQISS